MKCKELSEYLVKWLQYHIGLAGANGGVVGISGGIDSAVVAVLLKQSFPATCLGLWMPCYSSNSDREDAMKLSEKFSLYVREFHLEYATSEITSLINGTESDSFNIKARLRMIILYEFARKYNYLVIGTSNLSEYKLGYFTKWGDGAADLEPLISLYKSEIVELAKYLGVPDSIINKAPSAGLWEGQTDEGEMGVTYDQIEQFFSPKVGGLDYEVINRINDMIDRTDHKRHAIPAPSRMDISLFKEM